jgi:uridine kinase
MGDMSDPIETIRHLLAERVPAGRPAFVGIDGLSCAGKTTFAGRLAEALGGDVVHGDDMSRPGRPLWEHERFVADVYEAVLADGAATYQRWHWTSQEPGEELTVTSAPVVVEGIHVTDEAVDVPWDVRVWVTVDEDVRIARAQEREGGARWECWSTNWMPQEAAYVAAQHPETRADVVVDGAS